MPQATYFPATKNTMLPKDTYKGKVVFISGGGTGLGKGMATKFSDLGATVVISSRRMNVLEDAAKEITEHTGNEVVPIQCDIRDAIAETSAVDACVDKGGLPNVVINNAA